VTTKILREEAQALAEQAQVALGKGDLDEMNRLAEDAEAKMTSADAMDAGASRLKALTGDFNRPMNNVPIASEDVKVYDSNDTTAQTKADYKPQSWVKGLPAMAQPMWVQDQMGPNIKEHARFQTDTFIKWMKAPSEQAFWKTATPDEAKAMQEDKFLCPIS